MAENLYDRWRRWSWLRRRLACILMGHWWSHTHYGIGTVTRTCGRCKGTQTAAQTS